MRYGDTWNHISYMQVKCAQTEGNVVWTGKDNDKYLSDFEGAWSLFLGNLKDEHKQNFKDEIDHRLDSAFRHCGTLGKEFIL
jgi:hypothetical protein